MPGMEYTVDVEGVPDGWVVDAETIGTFLADDTCPKGGGGHHEDGEEGEDGHGEDALVTTAEEGEDGHGEQTACTHTVVINQLTVVPPPDDEGGGGANPPDERVAAREPASGQRRASVDRRLDRSAHPRRSRSDGVRHRARAQQQAPPRGGERLTDQ